MTGGKHGQVLLRRPQLLSRRPGLHLLSTSAPALDGYVLFPRHSARPERVLVCVHGVSRNALEQIELLGPYAERHGCVLIAPVFAPGTFRDYQRLGRKGLGQRADLALIRLLNSISSMSGLDTGKVMMFGFSGGAQFAHRFAYAHSQRLSRLVLGAAGWYTMPDPGRSYPFGTADARGLDAVRFNLRAAARLPTMVVVGASDDREDDPELNRSAQVMHSQGRHRLARAGAWADAMQAYAAKQGSAAPVELRVLPGIGHSFSDAVSSGGLGELLFGFLDNGACDRDTASNAQAHGCAVCKVASSG